MKKRDTDLESGDPGGIEVSKTPRFFIGSTGAQGEAMSCVCVCVCASLSSNNELKQHSKESLGVLGQTSKQACKQA